uniref:Uncharacterized protein n=1 Tax=Anguilla anguilla TaxID=7936 RepID=A0A0E9QII2_ANGAN
MGRFHSRGNRGS